MYFNIGGLGGDAEFHDPKDPDNRNKKLSLPFKNPRP